MNTTKKITHITNPHLWIIEPGRIERFDGTAGVSESDFKEGTWVYVLSSGESGVTDSWWSAANMADARLADTPFGMGGLDEIERVSTTPASPGVSVSPSSAGSMYRVCWAIGMAEGSGDWVSSYEKSHSWAMAKNEEYGVGTHWVETRKDGGE